MNNESAQSDSTTELEVLPLNAIEANDRASIDMQIATAKRYPRSMELFKKRGIAMATLDDETAESCLYSRPVGRDPETGKQKYAEGMSVRMAEIVGASYGNLRVAAVIVEQNERFVRARGMAIDMEANFASSSEVIESTVKKNGQPCDERMRIVIAKSALSKARRDATFQVVPRALAKPIEAAVRRIITGDAKSLDKRRALAAGWITKLGIDPKRVYSALGIAGEAELTAEMLETLTGIKTAIKENDVKIDEAFPPLATASDKRPLSERLKEKNVTGTAAADQPTAEEKKQAPTETKTEAPEETAGPQEPAVDRDALVSRFQDRMLDLQISEAKIMAYAVKTKGLVPEGITALFELPTASLVKIETALGMIATGSKAK